MKKSLMAILLMLVFAVGSINSFAQTYGCSYTYTVWEWYEIFPNIGGWIPHTYEVWYDCGLPQPEMPPVS